jgi:hypothetical protein
MPPYKVVYVLYQRGMRTGGPEALHQLVHSLRSLGQEAYLTPLPGSAGKDRVGEYAHYDAPERPSFEDADGNALVVPETEIAHLRSARKAARVCWWLSIDFSPVFFAKRAPTYRYDFPPLERVKHGVRTGMGLAYRRSLRRPSWRETAHLAQSHYAWNYLYDHLDVVPSLVTDHTPTAQIDALPREPLGDRGRTVAYNPKKGGELVAEMRRRGLPYEFVPIENMSREEVLLTLCRSAVYMDLGHHPGKDRMPREATLAGALTLVARKGAAANSRDVPLPWEHKIAMSGDPVTNAAERLEEVFSDLAGHKERQAHYEVFVRGERQRFDREVDAFFVQGKYGSDLAGDSLAEPWA